MPANAKTTSEWFSRLSIPALGTNNEHKKPDSKQTFFANYFDHAHQNYRKLAHAAHNFSESSGKFGFTMTEIMRRMTMFEPLRDRYDYADEVAGVTIVQWLGSAAMLGIAAYAVVEGAHALAIKTGYLHDDHEDHSSRALIAMLAVAAVFVITSAIFMNAAISLITRPIITANQGYKKQDENRFYKQDINATDLSNALSDTVQNYMPQ